MFAEFCAKDINKEFTRGHRFEITTDSFCVTSHSDWMPPGSKPSRHLKVNAVVRYCLRNGDPGKETDRQLQITLNRSDIQKLFSAALNAGMLPGYEELVKAKKQLNKAIKTFGIKSK